MPFWYWNYLAYRTMARHYLILYIYMPSVNLPYQQSVGFPWEICISVPSDKIYRIRLWLNLSLLWVNPDNRIIRFRGGAFSYPVRFPFYIIVDRKNAWCSMRMELGSNSDNRFLKIFINECMFSPPRTSIDWNLAQ